MTINPPRRIKLGGQHWTVNHRKGIGDDGDYLYGRTRLRTSLIELEQAQSEQQKRDTLLHELLHAIPQLWQRPNTGARDMEAQYERSGHAPHLVHQHRRQACHGVHV